VRVSVDQLTQLDATLGAFPHHAPARPSPVDVSTTAAAWRLDAHDLRSLPFHQLLQLNLPVSLWTERPPNYFNGPRGR
jgi:hypothetical protein